MHLASNLFLFMRPLDLTFPAYCFFLLPRLNDLGIEILPSM